MKKSKILAVGLIALLMAGGLVLVGCNDLSKLAKCPASNKCEYVPNIGKRDSCTKDSCTVNQNITSGRARTCDCPS
jgi:hypothetical protein